MGFTVTERGLYQIYICGIANVLSSRKERCKVERLSLRMNDRELRSTTGRWAKLPQDIRS